MTTDLREEELQATYAWVDQIPLSRQKKNIARDFSDGVLVAEVIDYFLPKMVELHNYSPASSSPQKLENWRTLNRKVFSKLGFSIPEDILQDVIICKPGVIEYVLYVLKGRVELYRDNRSRLEAVTNGGDLYANVCQQHDLYDSPSLPASGFTEDIPHEGLHRHPGPAPRHFLKNYYQAHGSIKNVSANAPADYAFQSLPSISSRLPVSTKRLAYPANPPTQTFTTLPSLTRPQNVHVDKKGPANTTKVAKASNVVRSKNTDHPVFYGHNAQKKAVEHNVSANSVIKKAETEQKLMEYQETIQLLHMKVTRLEHLVNIKDMKIAELTKLLDSKHSHPPKR